MTLGTTLLSKVVELSPVALKLPVRLAPFALQQKVLGKILEPLLQQAIDDGDLDFLEGKWLKIEVTDLDKQWYFTLSDEQLQMADSRPDSDVCFSGQMNTLVLLAAKKVDPDTLFFRRKLMISGDTELGLEVKNLIDNLELDKLSPPVLFALNQYAQMIEQYGQSTIIKPSHQHTTPS